MKYSIATELKLYKELKEKYRQLIVEADNLECELQTLQLQLFQKLNEYLNKNFETFEFSIDNKDHTTILTLYTGIGRFEIDCTTYSVKFRDYRFSIELKQLQRKIDTLIDVYTSNIADKYSSLNFRVRTLKQSIEEIRTLLRQLFKTTKETKPKVAVTKTVTKTKQTTQKEVTTSATSRSGKA